jgi:hypothetical protein
MKLSFTIRDLLWLTAIIGLMIACWFDHRQLMKFNDSYESRAKEGSDRIEQLTETVRALRQLVDMQPTTTELSDTSKFDDKAVDLTFRSIWNARHQQKQSNAPTPSVSAPSTKQ